MRLSPTALTHAVEPVLGYLRGTAHRRGESGSHKLSALPFVTISREAGAGGMLLANRLAERLNAELTGGERQWSVFDRELVEKVAADHHITQELVDMLEHHNRTWLDDFFNGITFNYTPSELRIFRSLVSTVRALAQAGRVILVGRGGFLITRGMPGGLHVRIVAPLEQRIANLMRSGRETHAQATEHVLRLDQERAAFIQRYWPGTTLAPESFSITLNAAALSEEQMVTTVLEALKNAPVGVAR